MVILSAKPAFQTAERVLVRIPVQVAPKARIEMYLQTALAQKAPLKMILPNVNLVCQSARHVQTLIPVRAVPGDRIAMQIQTANV